MTDFCTQVSLNNESPLYGTASHANVWIMLEYSGRWAARALGDNELPDSVNTWLNEQAASIPNSRVLFIKQDSYQKQDTLYIARTEQDEQTLYRVRFESFEDLVGLDVAGVLSGEISAEIVNDPIVLVCTNGKRDQCCAKFGLPTYQALAQKIGAQAWQVTHLGGHRYASAIAVFPAGIYYGYIFAEQT
ncbi:MAG: sucrase ferredoxin, partial [Candidatus Promineifilaceae bacterium]